MDITPGEFADFCSIPSARTRRSDTRSSTRSETTGSLELLPPEEASEQLFMSEELDSEEDEEPTLNELEIGSQNGEPRRNLSSSDCDRDSPSSRNRRDGTPASLDELENSEDKELARLIKKMKKYDKILLQKLKHEKEVKLQRLLFQKQMLEELSAAEGKKEEKLASNENKFLALMPPPGQIQEMLHRLESEEFVPIFQTQIITDDDTRKSPLSPVTQGNKEETKSEGRKSSAQKSDSASLKSSTKKKIDFIKRNIELAKDAGNYVSMTDDEKARLGELLSDLDEIESGDQERGEAFTTRVAVSGEGYTPDTEETKRLAEIDEKIQALLPENEFDMICGTPKLGNATQNLQVASLGDKIFIDKKQNHSNERIEQIQKRLETIDEEWKRTFEGTTPRLTNEQLQRLLDECSNPRSSMSSSLSLSVLSQNTDFESRPQSEISLSTADEESTIEGSYYNQESARESNRSVVEKLPKETLQQLLAEARGSLGIATQDDDESENEQDSDSNRDTSTPLFHQVDRSQFSGERKKMESPVEISIEDFETPR